MDVAPKGVIPAIPTPFTRDGALGRRGCAATGRPPRRRRRRARDHDNGRDRRVPAPLREERRLVTEVVVSEAPARCRSSPVPRPAAPGRRSRSARTQPRAGADAAILTPPFYFRIPDEMLYAHFADVAASAALPVVVYNNPLYTGINLSPALIAVADGARRRRRPQAVQRRPGAARRGAPSAEAIRPLALHRASTASSTPRSASAPAGSSRPRRRSSRPPLVRLYDLVQEGDHEAALEQHRQLQPLNRFLEYDPGYVSPTKEALRCSGLDCGPVRRPLPDFPAGSGLRCRTAWPGSACSSRRLWHEARHVRARPRCARLGAVDGDMVVDLQAAYAGYLADVEGDPRAAAIAAVRIPADMTAFVAGLERSWQAAEQALEHGAPVVPARRGPRCWRRSCRR